MGVELLTERYRNQIADILSCYDRIIIQGTLPKWCYASGVTSYFYEHQIKIFDYPKWAQPLRDAIRENTERLARENEIEIEFVRSRSKKSFRKEKRVKRDSEPTRGGARTGVYFVGDGAVQHLPAVVRQEGKASVPEAGWDRIVTRGSAFPW